LNWISVNERKPEKRCLLLDKDGWIYIGYLNESGRFESTCGDETGTEVKFWMPLPEPPGWIYKGYLNESGRFEST
jgi:Protein of unknown function (DUF551)